MMDMLLTLIRGPACPSCFMPIVVLKSRATGVSGEIIFLDILLFCPSLAACTTAAEHGSQAHCVAGDHAGPLCARLAAACGFLARPLVWVRDTPHPARSLALHPLRLHMAPVFHTGSRSRAPDLAQKMLQGLFGTCPMDPRGFQAQSRCSRYGLGV